MSELFSEYFGLVQNHVPLYVYVCLLVVLLSGTILSLAVFGFKKGIRYSLWLLLVEYVFLLFFHMVVFRPHIRASELYSQPFWSYRAIHDGKEMLFPENIINVVVFLPVGFLLGCAFQKMKWWIVLLIGICISVAIEFLQFIYQRGLSEVDDVIHNGLGCLLGFVVFVVCVSLLKKLKSAIKA